jgi:hypothetical protein
MIPARARQCCDCGGTAIDRSPSDRCDPCRLARSERIVAIQMPATREVHKAIRRGLLPDLRKVKLKCTDCDEVARQYDHRDYDYPLLVAPVCIACNNRRGPAKQMVAFLQTSPSYPHLVRA